MWARSKGRASARSRSACSKCSVASTRSAISGLAVGDLDREHSLTRAVFHLFARIEQSFARRLARLPRDAPALKSPSTDAGGQLITGIEVHLVEEHRYPAGHERVTEAAGLPGMSRAGAGDETGCDTAARMRNLRPLSSDAHLNARQEPASRKVTRRPDPPTPSHRRG